MVEGEEGEEGKAEDGEEVAGMYLLCNLFQN